MTREEAIERFENVKANALVQKASGVSEYWQNEIDGTIEAIDMAIEALSERNIAREIATIIENEQDMRVMLQVVRCKDCKWWGGNKSTEHNNHICNRALNQDVDYWTKADDFCSYGERREE